MHPEAPHDEDQAPVIEINGDIAALGKNTLLLTLSGVKRGNTERHVESRGPSN